MLPASSDRIPTSNTNGRSSSGSTCTRACNSFWRRSTASLGTNQTRRGMCPPLTYSLGDLSCYQHHLYDMRAHLLTRRVRHLWYVGQLLSRAPLTRPFGHHLMLKHVLHNHLAPQLEVKF